MDMLKTDSALLTWTGLLSFKSLEILERIVTHIEKKRNITLKPYCIDFDGHTT
jgi:hypothetical protein